MNKRIDIREGFTIIEVTLVLGIAGLIFLLMVIALPALQRQSRDTERKDDVNHLLSEVKHYQTNNRGALPGLNEVAADAAIGPILNGGDDADASTWAGFYRDYLNNSFKDPGGDDYGLVIYECGSTVAGDNCSSLVTDAIANLAGKKFEELDRNIYIVKQATCSGSESSVVKASTNIRKLAAIFRAENSQFYCENT